MSLDHGETTYQCGAGTNQAFPFQPLTTNIYACSESDGTFGRVCPIDFDYCHPAVSVLVTWIVSPKSIDDAQT